MPRRPGRCYRDFGTPPYTRRKYIKSVPQLRIAKFDLGNTKMDFPLKIRLLAEDSGQIRMNALEAARISSNKYLETKLGTKGYHLRIVSYPHHILRENKMMAVVHADRLQDGMRNAFGSPIGRAARVRKGQTIIFVRTTPENLEHAKRSLKRAASKISVPTRIVIEKTEA